MQPFNWANVVSWVPLLACPAVPSQVRFLHSNHVGLRAHWRASRQWHPFSRQWHPAFCLLMIFIPSFAAAEDWPTYMHDNARTGVSGETLKLPLRPAWDYATPLPPQPAWPDSSKWDGWSKTYNLKTRQVFDRAYHVAVAGDALFFGSSSSDQVYCIDAATGKKRWSFFTEGPVRLAPTFHDGRIYFGSDDGFVYCLEAADGALVWKHRPGPRDRRIPGNGRVISVWPVRGSLVMQDGLLHGAAGMFPSETVFVFALDPATGEEVWKTEQDDLPVQGYLLASATRLYTPSGRDNPIVFDRGAGKRLRVVEGQGGTYALLTGDHIVFGPGKTGELGLVEGDQQDQLAQFAGNHMIVTPSMSYLHTDTHISGLDRPKYLEHSRVRKALMQEHRSHRDALKKLGADGDKEVIEKHKTEMARISVQLQEVAEQLKSCITYNEPCGQSLSLILAGDLLFAGGKDEVAAYAADSGKPLWKQAVDGDVYGLAVSGGRLFVSTDTGRIYCFQSAE